MNYKSAILFEFSVILTDFLIYGSSSSGKRVNYEVMGMAWVTTGFFFCCLGVENLIFLILAIIEGT